jgi:hypothetical protein
MPSGCGRDPDSPSSESSGMSDMLLGKSETEVRSVQLRTAPDSLQLSSKSCGSPWQCSRQTWYLELSPVFSMSQRQKCILAWRSQVKLNNVMCDLPAATYTEA